MSKFVKGVTGGIFILDMLFINSIGTLYQFDVVEDKLFIVIFVLFFLFNVLCFKYIKPLNNKILDYIVKHEDEDLNIEV